jgi:outer membrane protein
MKKFLILSAAIIACSFSSLYAQKYGHINSGEILKAMPGIDSVQIRMADFQKELENIYQGMVNEFQIKKDKFDKDAGTMTSTVRQLREKELTDLQSRIMEFQGSAQEDIEEKQFELLKPFQDKLQKAINDVAKEGQYNYIFDTQILLYSDGGEDITALIRKKLGMK